MAKSRIKKADELFSQYIRKRDGQCLHCGSTTGLQCHHVVPRTNYRLRYDPQNAITLCYRCHRYWWHVEDPDVTSAWFNETFPENRKYIEKHKHESTKNDYDQIIEALKKMLD